MKTDSVLARLPQQVSQLKVNINKTPIGLLNKTAQFSFTYHRECQDISLTMPYKPESYIRNSLHPIFTQNLPEGYIKVASKIYNSLQSMILLIR